MREHLRGWLTKKWLWLAACGLPVLALLALAAASQQYWQHRAAALERENSKLQQKELAHEAARESEQLIERARDLADSELIAQLVQDNSNAPPDRSAILGLTRGMVDALVVVSASQAVRFSATIAGDGLTEQPPPPAMMQRLALRAGAPAAVAEDRQIVARPIMSHGSSPAILGWVIVARAVHPAIAPPPPPDGALRRGGIVAVLSALAAIVLALLVFTRYVHRRQGVDARYKAIIDQANDGIVIVDAATLAVLYGNPAFLNRLGYTADEAQALTLRDIFADGTASPESVLMCLRKANSQMAINLQQRCKDGTLTDIEVRCNALDVDGRGVLAYVAHDVSLRRKAEQQLIENQHRLDRMAHHDQLTGLPNRHYLTAFLPDAISEAEAAGTKLGVVFLDLDRFKYINDTRGHETGDKLLQEVAGRLRAVVRETDVVIRMGGDEFVVVFRNVKSYDEVTAGAGDR